MTTQAHILIVDDDETLNRSLVSILGHEGYRLSSRASAADLVETLDQDRVDLLILDLGLPDEDGLSALERVKHHPVHRDIPILILSGAPASDVSAEAIGLGAADYVAKPFRLKELLARIESHLKTGRALVEARERATTESTLNEILEALAAATAPSEIYQSLVRRLSAGLKISRCSIVLDDENGETGTVVAASESPALRHLTIELRRYPELLGPMVTQSRLLISDVINDPLFASVRELWRIEGRLVPTTSVGTVPFRIQGRRAGACFIRTAGNDPPLTPGDLELVERVIRAATPALDRTYDFETAIRRQDEMRQLAETDPLTGLFNRRAFGERLGREVSRAARANTVLSCLMLDIDHFKGLNDTYGHSLGDRVLTQLADLLRREQRAMDILARLGGEEFVVLLPETGIRGARIYAERILRKVNAAMLGTAETSVQITVSIGIATFPDERVTDPDSLLRLADVNLLRAKADGRNRYRD